MSNMTTYPSLPRKIPVYAYCLNLIINKALLNQNFFFGWKYITYMVILYIWWMKADLEVNRVLWTIHIEKNIYNFIHILHYNKN